MQILQFDPDALGKDLYDFDLGVRGDLRLLTRIEKKRRTTTQGLDEIDAKEIERLRILDSGLAYSRSDCEERSHVCC